MTGDTLTPTNIAQIYTMVKHPVIGSYDYRHLEVKAREEMKDNRRACAHASTTRSSPSIDDNFMLSFLPRRWDSLESSSVCYATRPIVILT